MTQAVKNSTIATVAAPKPGLAWLHTGRLPLLDGLRGISIIAVVIAHAYVPSHHDCFARFVAFGNLGHLGVNCFFVISGLLITLLLLREHERKGKISLSKFYLRRAMRLFPALALYLAIVYPALRICGVFIQTKYWVAALTYTMCLMPNLHTAWAIGCLWSLSVEEHFYFIWPLLVAFLLPRRAAILAAIYVLLTPFIRLIVWKKLHGILDVDYCSPTQMCGIAVGCVLAYCAFFHSEIVNYWMSGWRRNAALIVAPLGLIASTVLGRKWGKYDIMFTDPMNSLLLALLVITLFYSPKLWASRLLNSRFLVGVGILSYSIYLWQQPFSYAAGSWLFHWPFNAIAGVLVALASYFLVEAPFLRLKDRMGKRAHGTVAPAAAPIAVLVQGAAV
jgi:peptidoglycan/LPS O-acetylase OafA/YrhL